MSIITLCALVLICCGEEESTDDTAKAPEKVGSATVSWSLDCQNIEDVSVVCQVYDASNSLLTYGGPWRCEDGIGMISYIPIGKDRKFILLVEDSSGGVLYRGYKNRISIIENENNNFVNIDLISFAPIISTPENGENSIAPPFLSWSYVTGAVRYRLIIADDSNFENVLIETNIAGPPYYPEGLISGIKYYWFVICLDVFGNESIISDIRFFTFQRPSASIISPNNLSIFYNVDYIVFSGSAIDSYGNSILGESLVWFSSIDGKIGEGESFSKSISSGFHTITLMAFDGENIGIDNIAITINTDIIINVPIVDINLPIDGNTFKEGQNIAFLGSGVDFEDGELTGDSLTWLSSIDGLVGTGESFNSNSLSQGIHTITLICEDNDGNKGSDYIDIVVD